jgi:uncharacterized protein YceK
MKKLLPLVIALCVLVLSACSSVAPQTQTSQEFSSVLSVEVDSQAVQSDIEAQYNGKVIAWYPENNLAILGLYQGELSALADPNKDVYGAPEVTAGGSRAWGGGSRAWGGGYKAWGGGAAVQRYQRLLKKTYPCGNKFAWLKVRTLLAT